MDKTKNTIEIFNKWAKQYQDKFMDMDLYHDTFESFCHQVEKKNAYILEIGCGPGNITRYLLEKRPDFKIHGIDLSARMIELAKINNPSADFTLMDARNIAKMTGKYDAIMCGFCLPYLSREESIQLIKDAAGLLNPDGILYLSTMEDDYHKSGFKRPSSGGQDQMYIYYHQADYLTHSLKENGFLIIDMQRKDYPEQDGTFTKDLVLIAKK